MNRSQKKKSKRSPKFLNEYYAPAIKFQAFDPRPPEISDVQKKIVDQMFDKNSRRKRKFGSRSGNQENIKEENLTKENSLDGGTNSMGLPVTDTMGHPVTKPLRMIESENLSENMNNNQSISDHIFDKNSRRKRKFGSVSGNREIIKRKKCDG